MIDLYNAVRNAKSMDEYNCQFDFSALDGYTEKTEDDLSMGMLFNEELNMLKSESRIPIAPIGVLILAVVGVVMCINDPLNFGKVIFTSIGIVMTVFTTFIFYKRMKVLNSNDISSVQRGVVLDKRNVWYRAGFDDAVGIREGYNPNPNIRIGRGKRQLFTFATIVFPDDRTYIKSVNIPRSATRINVEKGDTVVVYQIEGNPADAIPTHCCTIPQDFRDFISSAYGLTIR